MIGRGDASYSYAERQDLNMHVLFGGRERTLDEYRALFERCGLRLLRPLPTRGSHTILEAAP